MEGILYKPKNAYVIVSTDGLNPIFGEIMDILVVSNNIVIFHIRLCTFVHIIMLMQ